MCVGVFWLTKTYDCVWLNATIYIGPVVKGRLDRYKADWLNMKLGLL